MYFGGSSYPKHVSSQRKMVRKLRRNSLVRVNNQHEVGVFCTISVSYQGFCEGISDFWGLLGYISDRDRTGQGTQK